MIRQFKNLPGNGGNRSGLGSTQGIEQMNKIDDSNKRAATPDPKSVVPTLDDILNDDALALRNAMKVLESLVSFEFQASKGTFLAGYPYTLTDDQVGSILYMVYHVQDLVLVLNSNLEAAMNRLVGRHE